MTTNAYMLLTLRGGPFLFDVAWKSLVFVLLMTLIASAVRRASAARRHLVWLVTVYGLLCLPVLTLLLPSRQFSLPVSFAVRRLPIPALPVQASSPSGVAASTPALENTAAAVTTAGSQEAEHAAAWIPTAISASIPDSIASLKQASGSGTRRFLPGTWPLWIAGLWSMGAGVILLQMLGGLMAAHRMLRSCRPADSETLTSALHRAQAALAIARPCALRLGMTEGTPAVPMTAGVYPPIILLPADAQNWPVERLQAVLLHELGHVKRADWLTQMTAMLVCALYWFNPLVWRTARRLRLESEHACDDLALTAGLRATDYAQHLLAVVQALYRHRSTPMMATIAQRPEIETRLQCILADSRSRQPVGTRKMAAALALTVGVLSPLAVWQTRTAAQTTPHTAPAAEQSAPSAEVEAESLLRPIRLPNGVQVQLESVSGALEDGKLGLWQPDGSGLTKRVDTAFAHPPGERWFSVMLTYPAYQAGLGALITFSFQGTDVGHMSTVTHGGGPAGYTRTSYGVMFPTTQQRVTMIITAAAGARQTVISGPPERTTTRRFDTGEKALLSRAYTAKAMSQGHQIAIHGVKLILPTRYVKDCDYQLLYVDHAGKVRNFKYISGIIPDTTGPQTELRYIFRVSEAPLAQIKAFRLQSRPIRTAIFRDIALQPTSGTAPPTPR